MDDTKTRVKSDKNKDDSKTRDVKKDEKSVKMGDTKARVKGGKMDDFEARDKGGKKDEKKDEKMDDFFEEAENSEKMGDFFIKESVKIPINKLSTREDNPQEMSDKKFNDLVQKIKEEGFRNPIYVRPISDGNYEIYAGYHRYKAAIVLGYEELPAYVDEIDEDRAKFNMVKDNIVQGKLSAEKFTLLFNDLSKKYGEELTQEMFSLDESEMEKLYVQVKESLPKELQDKLEESKENIKTVQDLSQILNYIFNEYGDTLDYSFMIFDFMGKDHLWIRTNKELWTKLIKIRKECEEKKTDINEYILEIFQNL
jgi:ParB/RepB/Spo0J family partition protein